MSNVLGQSVANKEYERFVTGTGRYIGDAFFAGQAYARIVRSNIAHGKINAIHIDEAMALPGVIAVFTGKDVEQYLHPIPQRACPLPGMEHFLQKQIALDRVLYVGEPIAVVVAEDPYIAEDGAELVKADIEPLPVVIDAETSKKDETLLHPENGTNIATSYKTGFGAIEDAFERADLVVEETFYIHRQGATPLECRGLLAQWDDEAQKMSVFGATKVPFANRAILATMLELQEEQIELIEFDVGGSFGVKGDFYPEDFLIPYAAKTLNRPVKWIEDRQESLQALNHSRETHCTFAMAFDKQGKMLGMRGDLVVDHGAYTRTNTGVLAGKGAQFLPGPYKIGAVFFNVESVCTNKTPAGTYRGPGRYESTFIRERLIDIAAQRLGMDPVAIRQSNLIQPEEQPYDAGALVPGMASTVYDTGQYPLVLETALERFDWHNRAKDNGKLVDGRYIGLGLACFVESTGGGPGEYVRLTLRHDGRFDLALGTSSAGQSHETTMSQILAETLEIPFDGIRVKHGSTTLLDKGFGAYHSRSAVMCGNATRDAALKMRNLLLEKGAHQLQRNKDELAWEDGAIIEAQTGLRVLSLAELAQDIEPHDSPEARGSVEVIGEFMCDQLTYTFGVQCAQVAVDPETAKVEVLDFYCTEDVGRVIHPDVVHGQAVGAAVQGLGGTLLDEYIYDAAGQLVTATLADYLLPTSTDFPLVRGDTLELSPSAHNPLGVKGAGEGGIIGTGAVLANAVSAALANLDISITKLPISMKNLAPKLRNVREIQERESMEIKGEYSLPVARPQVWQALMDPEVLKQCIPGCTYIKATAENEYDLQVKSKIGPVSTTLDAKLKILDIVPEKSYRLVIDGSAGPAGFAKGEISVSLEESSSTGTDLVYDATGEIGGRLAQVGARLIEGVVARMSKQFFDRFERLLTMPAGEPTPSGTLTAPAVSTEQSLWPQMLPWLIAAASLGSAVTAIIMCALRG